MQPHGEPAPPSTTGPRADARHRHHPQPWPADRRAGQSAATCFSFPRPDHRRDHRFSTSTSQARDRGADIFGTPSTGRSTGSCRRPTAFVALQNNQVDVVVKTMTITCDRKKTGRLLDGVPERQPTDPGPAGFERSLASRPTCPAKRVCVARGTTSLERIQQITPPPIIVGVVTWADCLGGGAAASGRRGQHRRLDPGRPGGRRIRTCTSSVPASTRSPTGSASTCRTPGWCVFVNGTLERVRRGWHLEYVCTASG